MPSSAEGSPNSEQTSVAIQLSSEGSSQTAGVVSNKGATSKRVEGKRCGVCGDRALGYNFNAITCESCKAFFRRNALKNKEYRCPFNDECEVTAVTRRFCQRCRLRKCFEVGMKKEWIMTEEEKKKKRKKIEENRMRKVGEFDSASSSPQSQLVDESLEEERAQREGGEIFSKDSNCVGEEYCAPATTSELPLPLKTASVAVPKPKAVVVGRVRGEDNEAKVRRSSFQMDVHTPKLPNSDIPTQIPLRDVSDTANQIGIDTVSAFSNSSLINQSLTRSPSLDQRTFPQLIQRQNHFPQDPHPPSSESLVMGLLRESSQGSAEEETPIQSHSNNIELAEEDIRRKPTRKSLDLGGEDRDHFSPGVAIKTEHEEIENMSLNTHAVLDDFSSTSHIHRESEGPNLKFWQSSEFTSNFQIPHQGEHSNQMSIPKPQRFEFSIQESLNMIQSGSRERESQTSSASIKCNNVMESIVNTAISAEYSAFSLLTNSCSSQLNQAETIKITELLEASRGLNSPLCEEPNYKDLPNPSLINVINLTEIAIRRLIKMAKKIAAFKTFCQEDQIALLKGGCTEMMLLRSVSAYDPDKESWNIQQDHERFKNIKLKVLQAAPGNVYEEHKKFMLSFHPDWRHDTRIIALLAAIALFTPERANIIHPEAVRHEQSSYLYLLKRYLECRYGGCEGKTNYKKLLEIIGKLHILNEDHVRVFLEVNPQEVEPLLIEIFDLKQS